MVAFGVILGLAALFGPLRKRAWWVGGPIALAAVGALIGLDLWVGHLAALPWEQAGTVLAWLLMGHCARAAGGPVLPRSWGLVAALCGWMMGDLGATALMVGLVADRGTAIRCALVASAAAMISPIGSGVSLVVIDPALFGPLPVLLALVAWPVGGIPAGESSAAGASEQAPGRSGRVSVSLLLGATAAAAAWFPEYRLVALAVSASVLAFVGRDNLAPERFPAGDGVMVVAMALVAWGLRHSGLSREVLLGFELLREGLPAATNGILALLGVGLGMLLGESAAAPLLQSILGASALPPDPQVLGPMAAGVAIGGLGPLWIIWRHHGESEKGARPAVPFWRQAMRPFGMQLIIVLAWALLLEDLSI
ncbi:MAG: hypothetical protein ACI9VR_003792 [Cognaticolwellia sp.]|jgi:hypothetical protein